MGLFNRNKSKSWEIVRDRDYLDDPQTRDVHGTQNLERGEVGKIEGKSKERVIAVVFALIFAGIGHVFGMIVQRLLAFFRYMSEGSVSLLDFSISDIEVETTWHLYAWTGFVFLIAFLIAHERLMMNWRSRHSMIDSSDINTYENDQHIMLFEELQRKFDWFPNTGAHSSVQVSSMLSHMMLSNKGLKSVWVTERYDKDVFDEDGNILHHKGEVIYNEDGTPKKRRMPLIDEKFGQDLFTASGIPLSEKRIRKPVDVRNIEYNPKGPDGNRINRDKLPYDTVADLINNDWEFPEYEVQRPSGAYIVDTAPVNTMVLAITRAGKGQTVIEPTIDMWTREKRQNNIVINDPKGELLVKFFVPATIRGYEIVQFNLINPLNTDIYNPLGFAAEAAREGNFTKAASYIENIGDVFFPVDGADDPMWPNAANNAFKRSAFGLIDFYLEEEKKLRSEAKRTGKSEKVLMQELDDMWGKVTLYNAYQLFVVLSAKKTSDPEIVQIDDDDPVEEKDYLTLFFDATAKLPQNEMRKLVQNTDNALRAMAGSDKTIASVYGIALTAMSFFTDPTISTLTSGKPSQNFDAQGLSFPRRLGVRFSPEYLERHRYVGLESVWSAYEDINFEKELDPKKFGHTQIIDRDGWARSFFDGKFKKRKNYIKLQIRNPKSNLLVKTFYFELELTYKTDLSGRRYVRDPILGKKIIRDGVLRELQYDRRKKKFVYGDTMIKRPYKDILNPDKKEEIIEVPAISQRVVKYTERPKMIFFITPPHLMHYAKLILILIKQMVDVNFESSYLTKENQKPLYKTRYMLDELGNLQSEGSGIPALQTMLSIGLGQDQQFTLILQTLQQLRDVYGDSVDRVIQGNTENIVYLKSTDDAMIDTLVKISGTTHESRIDQKTITKDNERLFNKHEGRISYTMSTKERPVIQFNDFLFIKERNSIIIKAGSSPIWNRNETAYPMSWRLFQNTLRIPGKEFSLQTIPTNSSAKDFDVRKNQPDFFAMVNHRRAQAKLVKEQTENYKKAYNLTDADFIRLDQNVVADEIMDAVNRTLEMETEEQLMARQMIESGEMTEIMIDEFGMPIEQTEHLRESAEENTELMKEKAEAEVKQRYQEDKIYAGGLLSRANIRTGQFDPLLANAYRETINHFKNDNNFRVNEETGELQSPEGTVYVTSNRGRIKEDMEALERGGKDPNSRVYTEEEIDVADIEHYEVTPAFIDYLLGLDSWVDIAGGRFDKAVKREYELKEKS